MSNQECCDIGPKNRESDVLDVVFDVTGSTKEVALELPVFA